MMPVTIAAGLALHRIECVRSHGRIKNYTNDGTVKKREQALEPSSLNASIGVSRKL